jgi:2-C-methyl-D-erythritol 2,4-cyclodiphosphate synthase
LLAQAGWGIVHIDSTIIIEAPQISPVREEIRAVLADALGVELAQVSVKATRGEGMGFVGRQEGAAALALATIEARAGNPPRV